MSMSIEPSCVEFSCVELSCVELSCIEPSCKSKYSNVPENEMPVLDVNS